ncbi:hypothetical protein [Massilia sp. H6]|uniref:hypothetical protein n=1 Tax=Massilia sp. H6 TaxID=2970464 RepID=UPI002167C553|nr:hypothetical protein [Massilia sp. H6]UVW30220.1 hypothetical protein NRS07_08910 [Massilia sp. H6]
MFFSSLKGQGPHSAVRAMALVRKRLLVQVGAVAGEPDERFPAAFMRLVAEIEAALRKEETLMEAVGFPNLREQRRDNALLLAGLHHALAQVEGDQPATGRGALAALPDLLSLHRFSGLAVLAAARHGERARRRVRAAGPARSSGARARRE